MCGILGSVNVQFDYSVLDLIKHRGPDDFGIDETILNGNVVKFGQRRLSIIDLSPAGHQPMVSNCGNYMLILNGEIYNHQELREKIKTEIKYNGHSDTETVLYYLKEFGIEGIRDLNGIFALAFLDKNDNKLFLARDPFGVKPLYYSINEDHELVFSSEIRPIKALLKKYSLNKDALAGLLRLRYNPSPDTLYRQIKKIHPGHYLKIDLNENKLLLEHHSFLSEIPETVNYPSGDVVRIYGEKLEEAVKRQLLSDVEVGILLSGGIDSALVAALAKKHYSGKLKTFTIGFEGNYLEDEIEDAAHTAEFLGLEHKFRKISFTDFLNLIKKCTHIVEEPLATTSIIPMFFLSELASKDVKVVLTGQGADEPLGGYTRYKSELLRNKIPGFLRTSFISPGLMKRIRNENILRGVKAIGVEKDIDRFLSAWEVFSNEEIEKLIYTSDRLNYKKIEYLYEILNCKRKINPVEKMMALDARLNLADDLLNYTDKITMNFALECRVPMLDLELVNFIESLPAHLKLNLRGGKLIHKQFASEILPGSIINRKKKGFLSPTNNWFKNEAATIREILLEGGTNFSKVFNQTYVAEIIKLHLQGYNKEKQIFLLLSIFYWLDSFTGEVSDK
ncbi:MAG: asparagine synthase (glutamine-hydrolyzing) [Bacteroidota bacterium]